MEFYFPQVRVNFNETPCWYLQFEQNTALRFGHLTNTLKTTMYVSIHMYVAYM